MTEHYEPGIIEVPGFLLDEDLRWLDEQARIAGLAGARRAVDITPDPHLRATIWK